MNSVLPQPEPGQGTEDQTNSKVAPRELRLIRSTDLFQGEREVKIEHAGNAYRLRITKAGKLILFK